MPPIVSKQNNRPPAKVARGSLLSRVQPVSQVDSGGLKLSLYGRSKTGKTRLLGSFPKPLVIIGAEDGTRSIRTVEGCHFVRVYVDGAKLDAADEQAGNYIWLSQLESFVEELAGSDFASVGIDTASALYDLCLAAILGLNELPAQRSFGMASRDQYGQAGLQIKTFLRKLLGLKQHVVVTAHERNFSEEGGGSELLTPVVGSALSASVTNWLNGAVDYICQTFIREEVLVREQKGIKGKDGQPVKTRTRTGRKEYCLRVGPHEVYQTGFRHPPGFELPEVVVNASYDKIRALANGEGEE